MKKNIILWGDLCVDKNNIAGQKVFSPGGSSFYCAKIFRDLGYHPLIVSPRGKDYDMSWLKGIPVFPKKEQSEHTLVYQNNYDSRGNRTLYSNHRDSAFCIDPTSMPRKEMSEVKAVILCPIDNNVNYLHVKKLKERMGSETLLACSPQGFFRKYKEDGKVYQGKWEEQEKIIPFLDIIFLSEEDGDNIIEQAVSWSRLGPLVIITKAEKGCSVFRNAERTDFPSFLVKKIIDPVGSGDVFLAAFISNWLKYKNIKKATIFANAVASYALSFHVLEMNIDIKEINKLISSYPNF